MNEPIRVGGGYWECEYGNTHHASEVCDCRNSAGSGAEGQSPRTTDDDLPHATVPLSGDMARFKNAVERLVDAFREFVPISALSRLAGPIATAHAELTALYQQAQKWKQYAQHALDCPAHPLIIEGAPDAPCDCGLDAVIVSTQPARPEDNG